MARYFDEDSGQYLDESEIDWNDYEVIQDEPSGPSDVDGVELPSWLSDAADYAADLPILGQAVKGAEGLLGATAGGMAALENFATGEQDVFGPIRQLATEQREEDRSEENLVEGAINDVAYGLGGILPFAATGAGTLAQAGRVGAITGADTYADMINQGADDWDAVKAAALSGAGNAALSAPVIGTLGGKIPFPLKYPLLIGEGAVGGRLGTGLDMYSRYIGSGQAPSPEQWEEGLDRGTILGALTTAALPPVVGGYKKLQGAVDNFRIQKGLDDFGAAMQEHSQMGAADPALPPQEIPPPDPLQPINPAELPVVQPEPPMLDPQMAKSIPGPEAMAIGQHTAELMQNPPPSDGPQQALPPPDMKVKLDAEDRAAIEASQLPKNTKVQTSAETFSKPVGEQLKTKQQERIEQVRAKSKDRRMSSEAGSVGAMNDFFDWMTGGRLKQFETGLQWTGKRRENKRPLGPVTGVVQAFEHAATTAEKNPVYEPTFRAGTGYMERQHSTMLDLFDDVETYRGYSNRKKVDEYLIKATLAGETHGFRLEMETPEFMARMGLDEADQAAVKAVRNTLNGRGIDLMVEAQIADPPANVQEQLRMAQANPNPETGQKMIETILANHEAKVREWGEGLRSMPYVPLMRRGKFFVHAPDGDGGKGVFSLHESRKGAIDAAADLVKQGISKDKIRLGDFEPPVSAAYNDMPVDVMGMLASVDPEVGAQFAARTGSGELPPRGFRARLTDRKGVLGFDQDVARGIGEYISSITNWHARKFGNQEFASAMKQIPNNSRLLETATKYKDYVLNGSQKEFNGIRKALAVYHLTKPITSVLNAFQTYSTVLPEIFAEVGVLKAPGIAGRAARRTGERLMKQAAQKFLKIQTDPNSFAKNDPAMAKMIRLAEREGVLGDNVARGLGMMAKGMERPGLSDLALSGLSATETLVRNYAFLSAIDIARAKGVSPEGQYQFAKDFVRNSAYDYTRANRPPVSRHYGALPTTFKLFQAGWVRQFMRNLQPGRRSGAVMQLLTMGSLAGALGMPIVKEAQQILQAGGIDVTGETRKKLEDNLKSRTWADLLMYGLPAAAGFNVSGLVGFGEVVPGIGQGADNALLRTLGGVPAVTAISNPARAAWLYNEMDNPWMAAEAVLPPVVRDVSEAARAYTNEGFLGSRNNRLVDQPSPYELAVTAMGGTPTRLTRAYEQAHSLDVLAEKARDNGNINFKLAKAWLEGSNDYAGKLLEEALEKGDRPDMDSVRQYMFEMQYPGLGKLKRMPKKVRAEAAETIERYDEDEEEDLFD